MWFLNSKASNVSAVLQSVPADVAASLKEKGPTEQVLTDLAALSFSDVDVMRAFVLDVAPSLPSESLHQVAHHLARTRLKANNKDVKDLFATATLARSFLGYEFVHHKEAAVSHIQDGGAVYSALSYVQFGVLSTGTMSMPVTMPEAAFFLFKKEGLDYSSFENDAATLKTNRSGGDEQIKHLNAVDRFIIKYFMAELDETRKEQEDRLMDDERGGYRGGRKVSVGLAIRDAIVKNELDRIPAIFTQALSDNGITYDEFFAGGTKSHLKEPLFSVLEEARPSTSPSYS